MSEKKPGYIPEELKGLSEEELKKIDEEAATRRQERLEGLEDKNLKLRLKKRVRTGLKVHSNVDFLRGRKEEAEDKEIGNKGLNKEIKKLLKQYKFTGIFRLVASHEIKGNYIFQLLAKPKGSVRFETELEFEDKAERVVSRLREYMENIYDKL